MEKINKRSGVFILLLAVAGITIICGADEKKPELTTAQYLEQLQIKLDHTARRINQPNAEGTSVVGLRGAKQESASKQLYWKGKKRNASITPDEVKTFRSAVEQARAGKTTEATASLKSFQEKYPKSALLPEVNETLSRLNTAPTP